MGSRALVYYITTTILAAIVGIFMVLVIHPGDPSIKTHVEGGSTDTKVSTLDAILDIVRYITFILNYWVMHPVARVSIKYWNNLRT
jgi:Na+/H+-dicarboxylate symporter